MHSALLRAVSILTAASVTTDTPPAPRSSAPYSLAVREVEVVGLDYAFRAPVELPPGRTVFHFVNRGKVRHEFNMVLLAPGVSIEQLNSILDPDHPHDTATAARLGRMMEATVGVLMAGPGERGSATLVTDLVPGRMYAIRCVARDTAMAPAQFALGMFSVLHVTKTPVPATPAPRLRGDTIVAMDYALRFPSTLAPGPHTVAFVNAGQKRHMALLALLRPGVTADRFKSAKSAQEAFPLIERLEGVLHTFPGMPQPLGVLEVQFLPRRDYIMLCNISDNATAPPHFMMGMFSSIHVTEK